MAAPSPPQMCIRDRGILGVFSALYGIINILANERASLTSKDKKVATLMRLDLANQVLNLVIGLSWIVVGALSSACPGQMYFLSTFFYVLYPSSGIMGLIPSIWKIREIRKAESMLKRFSLDKQDGAEGALSYLSSFFTLSPQEKAKCTQDPKSEALKIARKHAKLKRLVGEELYREIRDTLNEILEERDQATRLVKVKALLKKVLMEMRKREVMQWISITLNASCLIGSFVGLPTDLAGGSFFGLQVSGISPDVASGLNYFGDALWMGVNAGFEIGLDSEGISSYVAEEVADAFPLHPLAKKKSEWVMVPPIA